MFPWQPLIASTAHSLSKVTMDTTCINRITITVAMTTPSYHKIDSTDLSEHSKCFYINRSPLQYIQRVTTRGDIYWVEQRGLS